MCCWNSVAAVPSKSSISAARATLTARCTRTFNPASTGHRKSSSASPTEHPSTCGALVSLMNSHKKVFSSATQKAFEPRIFVARQQIKTWGIAEWSARIKTFRNYPGLSSPDNGCLGTKSSDIFEARSHVTLSSSERGGKSSENWIINVIGLDG